MKRRGKKAKRRHGVNKCWCDKPEPPPPPKTPTLEERVARIEGWIDQWESYDSGWNEYRKRKAAAIRREGA